MATKVCAQQAPPESRAVEPANAGRPRQRISPVQWVGLAVLLVLLLNQMGLLQLDNPSSIFGTLNSELPRFVALVLAITVHEFSHGFVATLFGDDLPRRVGRLTLNPLKHLDPIGTIMILVGPIGWGRPMPINPGAMRNPNLGWALSSLAGPVSNIVAATVAAALYVASGTSVDSGVFIYVHAFILINVLLAVFNLLPIPPLDGFGVLFGLAPRPLKIALSPLQRYGTFILIAFVFLPPLQRVLSSFIGVGSRIILPSLEVVCQCPLIGSRF